MRTLLTVTFPTERFNELVQDGTVGEKMARVLEALKPEAVYFTEQNGHRTGFIVVDLAEASRIPALAEPWFLLFNAQVEFRTVMTPDDLRQADLNALGKQWS